MNQTQVPAWVASQKRRSAWRREAQQEIFEALMGIDARMLPHCESKWDE